MEASLAEAIGVPVSIIRFSLASQAREAVPVELSARIFPSEGSNATLGEALVAATTLFASPHLASSVLGAEVAAFRGVSLLYHNPPPLAPPPFSPPEKRGWSWRRRLALILGLCIPLGLLGLCLIAAVVGVCVRRRRGRQKQAGVAPAPSKSEAGGSPSAEPAPARLSLADAACASHAAASAGAALRLHAAIAKLPGGDDDTKETNTADTAVEPPPAAESRPPAPFSIANAAAAHSAASSAGAALAAHAAISRLPGPDASESGGGKLEPIQSAPAFTLPPLPAGLPRVNSSQFEISSASASVSQKKEQAQLD